MSKHADHLFGISAGIALSVAALATLPALATVTARAEETRPEHVLQILTAEVSLADLDLTTAEGLNLAYERVHQTARRLCTRLQETQSLAHHPALVRCVDEALKGAGDELSALAATRRTGEIALTSALMSPAPGT